LQEKGCKKQQTGSAKPKAAEKKSWKKARSREEKLGVTRLGFLILNKVKD
jgi:hypothetical protein